MRKKKTAYFQPFEGRSQTDKHIRITASMMKHPAWKSLKPIAIKLYCHLKQKYRGDSEIVFTCTYTEVFNEVGLNDRSTKAAFDDLIKKGFLEEVENNRHRMKANKYKFSDKWQHFGAPAFEYRPKQRKVVIHKATIKKPP